MLFGNASILKDLVLYALPIPQQSPPFVPIYTRQFDVPVAEVSVHWTEMAGSKIRFTSILHMAFELITIKVRGEGL